jgi:hypothetical protein
LGGKRGKPVGSSEEGVKDGEKKKKGDADEALVLCPQGFETQAMDVKSTIQGMHVNWAYASTLHLTENVNEVGAKGEMRVFFKRIQGHMKNPIMARKSWEGWKTSGAWRGRRRGIVGSQSTAGKIFLNL